MKTKDITSRRGYLLLLVLVFILAFATGSNFSSFKAGLLGEPEPMASPSAE